MKQDYINRINDCYSMTVQLVNVYGVELVKARRAFIDTTIKITDSAIKDDTLNTHDFNKILDFFNKCYDKLDSMREV